MKFSEHTHQVAGVKSQLLFPVLEDRDGERRDRVTNRSRRCGATSRRTERGSRGRDAAAAAAESLQERHGEERAGRSRTKARRKSESSRAAPENLTLKQHCDLLEE